jgi:hypothetical protein
MSPTSSSNWRRVLAEAGLGAFTFVVRWRMPFRRTVEKLEPR